MYTFKIYSMNVGRGFRFNMQQKKKKTCKEHKVLQIKTFLRGDIMIIILVDI